ncbi:hypothetical protein K491DRAFT_133745 [Lophiostoma macrostomum CBS 122681]|uniref:gamma-glutamylcyclotransferase n=1 Tax=Lophiostoma macrostomum CBS 122681 TaxID=1314788 RepID=A0A6A6SRW2_9PLEO|nr:hypothetical protein K491DRAFT_133745 [Lophiostoma macrostomum CBS 122681]
MPSDTKQTIYFGYGSNLWLEQMRTRCPTSNYLGVARLDGYRWIINERGYANVVETNFSSGQNDPATDTNSEVREESEKYANVVFGLVYSLEDEDEKRLDGNEGVPVAYTKEDLNCTLWESRDGGCVDVHEKTGAVREMLVYINRNQTREHGPKKEYISRMNQGIKDAVKQGVPEKYVVKVMRKFIPKDSDEERRKSVEEKALRQMKKFEDENGVVGSEHAR